MQATSGASERVLRSLVPAEQWPYPQAFWIDTPSHGKWVVDLDNVSCIHMVVLREAQEPSCPCSACTMELDRQVKTYGISAEYWLRPRGILLGNNNRGFDPFSWEAKVARGLSIAMMLMTDPGGVNRMCCG